MSDDELRALGWPHRVLILLAVGMAALAFVVDYVWIVGAMFVWCMGFARLDKRVIRLLFSCRPLVGAAFSEVMFRRPDGRK